MITMLLRVILRLSRWNRGVCTHRRSIYQSTGTNRRPPELDSTVIYLSSDRYRFYRSLGIFCFIQGTAWAVFTGYLALRSNSDWETISTDVDWLNHQVVAKLESITPDVVTRYILRPSKKHPAPTKCDQPLADDSFCMSNPTEKDVPNQSDDQKTSCQRSGNETSSLLPTSSEAPVTMPILCEKDEEKSASGVMQFCKSEAKSLAAEIRAKFGINDGDMNSGSISSKQFLPFLTGTMCLFTYVIGGIIPRRVVRKISILPRNSMSQDPLNPTLNIHTYGTFGISPRNGVHFTTPLHQVRATSPHTDGAKFMNLQIHDRFFVFYLEKFQAEFLLPEYFEHLNENAINKK